MLPICFVICFLWWQVLDFDAFVGAALQVNCTYYTDRKCKYAHCQSVLCYLFSMEASDVRFWYIYRDRIKEIGSVNYCQSVLWYKFSMEASVRFWYIFAGVILQANCTIYADRKCK